MIGMIIAVSVAVLACAALLWLLAQERAEVRRLTNLLVAEGDTRKFAHIQDASTPEPKVRREPELDPELMALGLGQDGWT